MGERETATGYPCWCWRRNPAGDDVCCVECGWPKAHHHDNGYRSSPTNTSESQP